MKKFKLFATTLAAVAALSAATLGLTACGGTEGGNNGGTNTDNTGNNITNDAGYVFEAEYTDLTGMASNGYSNEVEGIGLIHPDDPDTDNDQYDIVIGQPGLAKASNGFYLWCLYKKGLTITFKINSDVEVNDAKLSMRLSGELVETLELTDEEWVVKVNGEQMKYGKVTIDNININNSRDREREFQDFVVASNVHLVKGENTITFTVNNTRYMGGKANSAAPYFDCIKIETSAKLTWKPITDNLSKWEAKEDDE